MLEVWLGRGGQAETNNACKYTKINKYWRKKTRLMVILLNYVAQQLTLT